MTWLFGQARDGKMVRWREGLTLRRNCTQLSSDSVKLNYYLKIQTKLIPVITSEDYQCCDSSNGHPHLDDCGYGYPHFCHSGKGIHILAIAATPHGYGYPHFCHSGKGIHILAIAATPHGDGYPYFGLTDKTLVIPVSGVPARDPEGLSYTKF